MQYGSGSRPAWIRSEENGVPSQRRGASSGSGNSQSSSYQNMTTPSPSYQAPQLSGAYEQRQTRVVEDAVRTNVEAETTAGNVLTQLEAQRNQLQRADDDAWAMREDVARAQRELRELQQKTWEKKRRLYAVIGALSFVDAMLFFRIVQCGGSFFCRRY
mmetsp:Transcript_34021/g.81434  ORF Transcript_34021/g.81434 Transcript_34021/m.81434 type:complete len:159 (-) Transcript_34021:175-651(-)